ncbi:MAG TPA: hypothetical protein VMV13_12040 [Candidatus Binataceae bacterium]|nr:hypothetical protein [Candidatus Binataceae bacterium]
MDPSKAAILWYASSNMIAHPDNSPPNQHPSDEQVVHQSSRMTVKDLLAALDADGWQSLPESAGCKRLRRPGQPFVLTIAGKPADALAADTLESFLKAAGLAVKS